MAKALNSFGYAPEFFFYSVTNLFISSLGTLENVVSRIVAHYHNKFTFPFNMKVL